MEYTSFGINPEGKYDPVGIKAWYPPEEGKEPNKEIVEAYRIKFINFYRGKGFVPITKETYEAFCETDEYKQILEKIREDLQVHEQLLEEYENYCLSSEIEQYQRYVDDESKRRSDIHSRKRIELFEQISMQLPEGMKTFLDNKCSNVYEKSKLFLGDDIEMKLYVEYFSQKDEDKLSDPTVSQDEKDNIYCYRGNYLRQMGVTDKYSFRFESKKDFYDYCTSQEGAKDLIPTNELADKITELRPEKYEEFQREFIYNSQDFIENASHLDDNQSNKEVIYGMKKLKRICVCGGSNSKGFMPVLFYTVLAGVGGKLDYIFLHEVCHAIETEEIPELGIRSGFNFCVNGLPLNPYNREKLIYERTNETIDDMLAIETRQALHEEGIYILEPKEHIREDVKDFNTHTILKEMLTPLLTKYREPVIRARLFGDVKDLFDIIGVENFEELNDSINKVDSLEGLEGIVQKLRNNQNEDPVIVEYNKQLARVEQIYADMDAHRSRNGMQMGNISFSGDDLLKSAIIATEETTTTGQIEDVVTTLTQTIQKSSEKELDKLEDMRN